MSDSHTGARHVDPLEALRSIDRRPLVDVWRERLKAIVDRPIVQRTVRGGAVFVAIIVATGVAWQLFAESAPPVEASIPYASASTATPPSDADARTDLPPGLLDTSADDDALAQGVAAPVVVHVAGAVARPGLVEGATGWRVDDVIRAAGGALAVADLDRLNLAALVVDGERVYVPTAGEDVPPPLAGGGRGGSVDAASSIVDINTADLVELQALPGIGPATASTIVEHRDAHGAFASVDALVAVRGIGPATLEALREHVRVS